MAQTLPFPFELETERLMIRSPSAADAQQLVEAIEETMDTLRLWMPWVTIIRANTLAFSERPDLS